MSVNTLRSVRITYQFWQARARVLNCLEGNILRLNKVIVMEGDCKVAEPKMN
jgi:hypothetical protein